jgi:hypothetical protein
MPTGEAAMSEAPGPADDDQAASWLAGSPQVNQAAGMITVQLGVDVTEAISQLFNYARTTQQPLIDVASDVIGRRLRLSPPPEPG